MRCLLKSLVAITACGAFVLFAPYAYYRYGHWPRDVDYAGLVSFADQQLKYHPADNQVPDKLWPDAVRKLKPTNVYLDHTNSCVDIVLDHGGVFRGDTEFRVVPNGYKPEKVTSNDVILPTSHPRVFRIDLQY